MFLLLGGSMGFNLHAVNIHINTNKSTTAQAGEKYKHRFEILIIFEILRLNFQTIGHYDPFTRESDFTLD
jgi:hypothetical protein